MKKYRAYVWVHEYISNVQKAVQAAHVIAELVALHHDCEKVKRWANVDKTLIILSGGNSASMADILRIISDPGQIDVPVASFHEDKETLDGMLTACALVIDEDEVENLRAPQNLIDWQFMRMRSKFSAELVDVFHKPLVRM